MVGCAQDDMPGGPGKPDGYRVCGVSGGGNGCAQGDISGGGCSSPAAPAASACMADALRGRCDIRSLTNPTIHQNINPVAPDDDYRPRPLNRTRSPGTAQNDPRPNSTPE